jgi:methylation protein EvaC
MLKEFLDLGKQPIANGLLDPIPGGYGYAGSNYKYDLKVGFDTKTALVTQMEYVDPPLMFNEHYVYRGSMSKTMRDHFKMLSYEIGQSSKILEIGSNDGVFIKNFNTKNTIAVEPCGNFARETQEMGYTTYADFWNQDLADTIKEEKGKQDIIFSANCICHIPDLDQTFKAVESLLSEDGTFIFEDPSLAQMVNNNSYDQIYDEHPHIFSVIALDNILKRNGLQIVKVENLTVHGGSNRIYAKRMGYPIDDSVENNKRYERILGLHKLSTFKQFAKRVGQSRKDLISILNNCKKEGKKVISYGATSKSTTVFNYCNLNWKDIEYITDTTPEKQGKLAPGSLIPIVKAEDSIPEDVEYVYLGAWNFINEIKQKENSFVERGGKFITHVPNVRIV